MSETKSSLPTTLRTHTCGELRMSDVGKEITISGWVQNARDMNHFVFVDIRDRFGITQLVIPNDNDTAPKIEDGHEDSNSTIKSGEGLYALGQRMGREWVLQAHGVVKERINKNANRDTGDIEIDVQWIKVLNKSLTPPFKIEDETDGGEDIRMKFRYLDIRRNPVRDGLIMRSKLAQSVRNYLTEMNFIEVETPVLIKSTPEGARDFVVPSRMNPGKFYALPQSPQTFKQILMVAGIDRYFQIVKCFRDEELRADRQPEFTQIDCEMSFVDQEDILSTFEGLIVRIFKDVVNHTFPSFERMKYDDAMMHYGIDKPDTRFDMKLKDLTSIMKGKGMPMLDDADVIVGISVPTLASYSKKKLKDLEKQAQDSSVGAKALFYIKVTSLDESKLDLTSSISKFFNQEELLSICKACDSKEGDLVCIFAGEGINKVREQMGKFRNKMGDLLGYRSSGFKALWVTNFPLLEYDEDEKRWNAMHHPFTSPYEEDLKLMHTDPGAIRARAYDMVINGVEIGGGSIRIHDKQVQEQMFKLLGFTPETAQEQFGFLMGAFEYGAPPHGGLAFGFDRLCTILGGKTSIRDYIAFPKNKMGRDLMIDAPSNIEDKQLKELSIDVVIAANESDVVAE